MTKRNNNAATTIVLVQTSVIEVSDGVTATYYETRRGNVKAGYVVTESVDGAETHYAFNRKRRLVCSSANLQSAVAASAHRLTRRMIRLLKDFAAKDTGKVGGETHSALSRRGLSTATGRLTKLGKNVLADVIDVDAKRVSI